MNVLCFKCCQTFSKSTFHSSNKQGYKWLIISQQWMIEDDKVYFDERYGLGWTMISSVMNATLSMHKNRSSLTATWIGRNTTTIWPFWWVSCQVNNTDLFPPMMFQGGTWCMIVRLQMVPMWMMLTNDAGGWWTKQVRWVNIRDDYTKINEHTSKV